MAVLKVVANIAVTEVEATQQFYADLLGLDTVMDLGWIVTLATGTSAPVQISFATEGGSGTIVPDLSIEVDDVDALYKRAKEMGCKIVYDLTTEPWGVRRFYVNDPAGKTLNVLSHQK